MAIKTLLLVIYAGMYTSSASLLRVAFLWRNKCNFTLTYVLRNIPLNYMIRTEMGQYDIYMKYLYMYLQKSHPVSPIMYWLTFSLTAILLLAFILILFSAQFTFYFFLRLNSRILSLSKISYLLLSFCPIMFLC